LHTYPLYCADTRNSAVDDVQVQLSVFGTALSRIEQHVTTHSNGNTSSNGSSGSGYATDTAAPASSISPPTAVRSAARCAGAAAAAAQQQEQQPYLSTDVMFMTSSASALVGGSGSSSSSRSIADTDAGNGPAFNSAAYRSLESTLSQLQVAPDAVTRLQEAPIGKGGFAKVYKVQRAARSSDDSSRVCAAKVVKLTELAPRQLQKVYLRFAKELFILSKLQHARVVKLYGCVSTVGDLTILMEVSSTA
jgi:Protein tyrosine and serine/threonine kinase